MAVKNAASKNWPIAPSSDGRRWSAYPAGDKPVGVYTTTFSADADPLSESSEWSKNASNAWSQMRAISGNAVGSQGVGANSGNDYNDSYAIKTGSWGADYELDAIVYRSASISAANHEVELNVRFVDDADSVRGYEVLLNKDGLIQCFRWNDSFGSFSAELSGGTNVGSVPDGARYKVRIVGNTITVYYSSSGAAPSLVATYDISEVGAPQWNDGNPAIGQFCRPALDGSNAAHFGFQSVTITKL